MTVLYAAIGMLMPEWWTHASAHQTSEAAIAAVRSYAP